jgi:hypothetical protein
VPPRPPVGRERGSSDDAFVNIIEDLAPRLQAQRRYAVGDSVHAQTCTVTAAFDIPNPYGY